MTPLHWHVLLTYLIFTLAASVLALARRWFRPGERGESVWRKYPTYIAINLLFIAASWLQKDWYLLTGILAVLGFAAAWEIVHGLYPTDEDGLTQKWLPFITFILVISANWLSEMNLLKTWLGILMILIALISIAGKPEEYPRRALALAGCIVYLPLCLAAYQWAWQKDPSGFLTVFLYLVIATNDALAQLTGQLFGKHALAPQLSPSKTIEGALGGILFAAAMGAILSNTLGWTPLLGAGLGLLIGISGLTGDLIASSWKRALRLRNFSTLLGAQGGVLDRFDALLFAAPVFYLVTSLT